MQVLTAPWLGDFTEKQILDLRWWVVEGRERMRMQKSKRSLIHRQGPSAAAAHPTARSLPPAVCGSALLLEVGALRCSFSYSLLACPLGCVWCSQRRHHLLGGTSGNYGLMPFADQRKRGSC